MRKPLTPMSCFIAEVCQAADHADAVEAARRFADWLEDRGDSRGQDIWKSDDPVDAVMQMIMVVKRDTRNQRRRARRLELEPLVKYTVREMLDAKNNLHLESDHGGGVRNSYKYTARTDAVVTIARVVRGEIVCLVFAAEAHANKVTERAAASAAMYDCRLADDGWSLGGGD